MKTVINWRPYPERKPKPGTTYMVLLDGKINARRYNETKVFKNNAEWWTEHVPGERVTHFALPEDITTEES